MNEELVRLETLDRLDRELARIASDLARLAARLEERRAAAGTHTRALEEAEAALAASRTEERTAGRRLDELRASREAAMRVLTTGAGNAEAAQRQLERCDALIDEAETGMLQLLELQDGLIGRVAAAELARTAARASLAEEELAQPDQIGALEEARAARSAERAAVNAELPAELRSRYEGFRERGRYAVARARNGSCDACSMAVQAQMVADLKHDKLVACHGCHRWLVIA